MYWNLSLSAYRVALITVLLFYAYRNSRIQSRFREEGVTTRRVLFLSVCPVPFAIAVYIGLTVNPSLVWFYIATFWVGVFWQLFIPTVILSTIYIPKVRIGYRSR